MACECPLHVPVDWGLWMAAFYIYVDESGKLSGKSDYTSLCGYLAHAQEWQRFAVEWNACRLRWQVPAIHMTRIMSPDLREDDWKVKKEVWGELWESKRDQMLEEFAWIIHRSSLVCVGTVLDASSYRRIQKEEDCLLYWSDSNVFAFHYIIMTGLEKIETVDKCSPVSIVVDDDPDNAFGYGIQGTDERTTIRRTTLRLFGMVVTSSAPSMSVCPSMTECPGCLISFMLAFSGMVSSGEASHRSTHHRVLRDTLSPRAER